MKTHIEINTELRKEAKNEFEKDFFDLMNSSVFGKTMENVRNYRNIKLVTKDERRKQLVSEPNYHTSKFFSEHLMVVEMKKKNVKMNKLIYLGMSVLCISKTLTYEFWFDYIKPKYGDRAKLCYMDIGSFILHIKTEDFYEDIANDVEGRFDTSDFDKNHKRPLPIGKNKKIIGLFKSKLGAKIMSEFCALRAKTWACLMDDGSEPIKQRNRKMYNKKNILCLKIM